MNQFEGCFISQYRRAFVSSLFMGFPETYHTVRFYEILKSENLKVNLKILKLAISPVLFEKNTIICLLGV